MTIVCLGEALVDLIRRSAPDPDGRERFETHFGGALANVAVAAARAGSPASLAGAIGEDPFGRLLRDKLAAEGVDLRFLAVRPELVTPFAFVRFEAGGEPVFAVHGDAIEEAMAAVAGREVELATSASAVAIGSNSMVGRRGRGVTLSLLSAARARGVPVLFDPNLRLHRWPSTAAAVGCCLELLPRCWLVRTNLDEARLLAGAPIATAEEAAERLVGLGVPTAVVTAAAGGAVARGEGSGAARARPVADPNPLGAGDAFMGTLVAALQQRGWEAAAMQEALERASAAAAEACRRLGATD